MQIITDQTALRQVSKDIHDNQQIQEIIHALVESMPENGVGLAAPQIGQFHRIFIAKLSSGYYAFVNPRLFNQHQRLLPSVEGCLSIPGVTRCVSRHQSVSISADKITSVEDSTELTEMTLSYQDAFIVQHEFDHLNGVLMVDHEIAQTTEEKSQLRQQDRMKKLSEKRRDKKKGKKELEKINPRKSAKLKKLYKAIDKQNKKRVEQEERQRAVDDGLL